MSGLRSIHARLFIFIIIQALVVLVAVAVVSATTQASPAMDLSSHPSVSRLEPSRSSILSANALLAPQQGPTTLQVSIVSSPWALLDSNKPVTDGPHVLVVEAVVTNTGSFVAEDVVVNLNYNPDSSWYLLPGEALERNLRELPAGRTYHAYWFATYPRTSPQTPVTHQYTVTAGAANAAPVATSTNVFRPTGPTVETKRALSGGSTRLLQSTSSIIVGRAFTATVEWGLGTNFQDLLLSPVGNVDFDPSSYRLVAATISFMSGTIPLSTVNDRLYFATVPLHTTNARGQFRFLALRARGTQICPYTAPKFADFKYDNAYCGTSAIPVQGSVSLSLNKQVSAAYVQQGQLLTYNISYVNNGTLPLGNVWIWDNIDPAIGSLVASSIHPPSDPVETNAQRVAWFVNDIAPSGQPGSSGALAFTILVDGGGKDLVDQTPIVNHAFFGVDPAVLPAHAALTSTVTSTVRAPRIRIAKTDGLQTATLNEGLVYTLRITNTGSVTATAVILKDRLPDYVSNPDGQVHTWTLGPIPPNGGHDLRTLPATVAPVLPNGAVLTNIMTATYENLADWAFHPITATDTTLVSAPLLVLNKSDVPDPVAAGALLTYTLSYYHNGVTTANGITLVDTLPAGVVYDRLISQPGGWSGPAYNPGPPATLTWSLSALSAGTSGDIRFRVTVNPDVTGLISNEARISSTNPVTHTVTSEGTSVGAPDRATIYGYVYQDTNGNGLRDAGEPPIPNILVTLDGVSTTTTNANGLYYFITASAGVHAVVESDPIGAFSTTPNEVHVGVQFGTSYRVDFGDASATSLFATISGTVFNDTNSNGLWDAAEAGLPGVTITLNGVVTATTDQYGSYSRSILLPGLNTVVETDPAGYLSTTPNQVPVAVTLGHSYQVDFGDVLPALCTCPPDAYEQDDTMGQAKILDTRQAHNFCDDATDWTQFTAQAGNMYTITTSAGGPASYLGRRADTYLALMDSHSNVLMANDDFPGTQDHSSRIIWQAPANGTYYLRATNMAGLTGCLTDYEVWMGKLEGTVVFLPLVARQFGAPPMAPQGYDSARLKSARLPALGAAEGALSPTGVIYHTCPDSYETDDTWQEAKPIYSGIVQTHSFDSDPDLYAADKDYVYLDIEAGRTVTFTVPAVTNTLTLLEIYDKEGFALPGATGSDELIWTPSVSGRYYLGVSPQIKAFGCTGQVGYDLLMRLEGMSYIYLPLVLRNYPGP